MLTTKHKEIGLRIIEGNANSGNVRMYDSSLDEVFGTSQWNLNLIRMLQLGSMHLLE